VTAVNPTATVSAAALRRTFDVDMSHLRA
jgi:hypothetical protein